MSAAIHSIWNTAATLRFGSEADVEQWLIGPLLPALGYDDCDIRAKVPIIFQKGRTGRRAEADFIVYHGPLRSTDTSLIVVEAKKPGVGLEDARSQAESYAFNARAPLLLLTDGIDFEIWQLQPTMESVQALTCKVANLAANRGRIESLICRDAAVAHCRSLKLKQLPTPSGLFASYENAELKRVSKFESVARTLMGPEGDEIASGDLVVRAAGGAIIVASSGLGKSTLATAMHKAALAERLRSSSELLSVEVQLPDIAAEESTITEYILNRIRAHAPAVTAAALLEYLRSDGVQLLCDRLDRVPTERRAAIEVQLRNILRDFPRCRVVVFDRAGGTSSLGLPQFELLSLTDDEQGALAEYILAEDGNLALHNLPSSLEVLAEHPLLLTRMLAHYRTTGKFLSLLSDLFEAWLDQLLERATREASVFVTLRSALQLLADRSVAAPIPIADALARLTAPNKTVCIG